MKRIAIYSRKSVLTDTGESTKVQIKLCKNYFSTLECEFIEIVDEGFSGGNTNRPGFKKLMRLVERKEIDIVAVYKIDRIARNIIDFFSIYKELEKHDVKLISITEGFDASTPNGVMMMTMLAGFSEMERMNIKQRVRDNMKEIALKGKWSGGNPPIGYESIRVVEAGKKCSYLKLKNNEEIEIVRDIYNCFLDGYSTRKIADKINLKYGLSTSQKRICNILYSPVYTPSSEIINNYLNKNGYEVSNDPNGCGYLTYQKTKINKSGKKVLDRENKTIAAASKHEAIIPNNLWLKVQQKLSGITQDPKPRKSQYTFLAHLVKCGYCETSMFVDSEPRKKEPQRFFRKKCKCNYNNSKRLTIDLAEKSFVQSIISINDKEIISNMLEENKTLHKKDYVKEIKLLKNRINELNKKIDGLTEKLALVEGKLVNVLIKQLEKMVDNKNNLENELLELQKSNEVCESEKVSVNKIHILINQLINDISEGNLTKEEINLKIERVFECLYWFPIERELKVKIRTM